MSGLAVYRVYENTTSGKHLYVDDLVTDTDKGSQGVGKFLIERLQNIAQLQHCRVFTLDSANHRHEAHKFYFREDFTIVASHFAKYF